MDIFKEIEQDLKFENWWTSGPIEFLFTNKWNWFITNQDVGILLFEAKNTANENVVYDDKYCKILHLGEKYTMFTSRIVCREEMSDLKYIVLNSNQDQDLIQVDCVTDTDDDKDNREEHEEESE